MDITGEVINNAINGHKTYLNDVLTGKIVGVSATDILDDRYCKLGTLISRLAFKAGKYGEVNLIHKDFHYHCAILFTLDELGCERPQALIDKIHRISDDLVEILVNYEE